MGLIFFAFFEKFFVPILTSGGLAAVSSSFFAALCSAFGRYDVVHIHAEGPAFFAWLPKMFGKRVVVTVHGIDWQREKWQSGLGSKFIHQGEKNAAKYADEVIVLSKGVQKYFLETYGRETHFIPNGVNRPEVREARLIKDHFGLEKDSYILFLGRLVPEKGIRYLVEAFKNVKTDKKLVIAGGSSDTDSFMEELKELAKGDDQILFTGFVQGTMLDELYSNAYIYTLPSDLEGMPLSLLEAKPDAVTDINVLKKGMTNRSFLFTCKGKKYIMRIPGEGTDQLINRRQEAAVYQTIDGKHICDDIAYINPENGYKITEFLEGARVWIPEGPQQSYQADRRRTGSRKCTKYFSLEDQRYEQSGHRRPVECKKGTVPSYAKATERCKAEPSLPQER